MPQTELEKKQAHVGAVHKFRQKSTKQIAFELNLNTDADIIEKLNNVPSKMGYIKALIRADIAKKE